MMWKPPSFRPPRIRPPRIYPPRSSWKSPPKPERLSSEYERHLRSPEWIAFRDGVLAERGRCCEFCGSSFAGDPLHLHHLTYERLGHELPTDVVVLCWSCHADVHEFPRFREQVERFVLARGDRRLAEEALADE